MKPAEVTFRDARDAESRVRLMREVGRVGRDLQLTAKLFDVDLTDLIDEMVRTLRGESDV